MLRAALLTLVILILFPAAANAACRTAPVADVWYDSPALQVWADNHGFVSCVRATGTEHVYRDAGDDPEARLEFGGVSEDRWVTIVREKGYWSDITSVEHLGSDTFDAWSGEIAHGAAWGYVETGPGGVVAHYSDGRVEVLDPAPVAADLQLTFQGRRIYWRTPTGPRTAVLNPPPAPAAPSLKPLRARTMTNCTPRPRANLVARYRRVVVTRKGKSVHACFNRRVTPIGNATTVQSMGSSDIAYARPGYTGYLDVARGVKRELPSAGGPLAATLWTIAAVDRKGVLRVWNVDHKRPKVVTRAGASDVAVTYEEVFWLAPDGTPHVQDVR